jgi:cell division protein FtsL
VLVAFSVTYRHAAITRLGYEAEGLERELALLRKLNGELQTKVTAAGSLGRVQQLAQSQLGMVLPKQTVVVAMPGAAPGNQPGVAAISAQEPDVLEQGSGGVLSRLWRLVLRLTGVPAEAAAVPR